MHVTSSPPACGSQAACSSGRQRSARAPLPRAAATARTSAVESAQPLLNGTAPRRPSQQPAPLASRDGGAAACSRRTALGGGLLAALSALAVAAPFSASAEEAQAAAAFAADEALVAKIQAIQLEAARAFAEQDFKGAEALLTELIELDPQNYSWFEGRAQVRLDFKRFDVAIADYNAALGIALSQGLGGGGAEARLRAGRALAYEGVSKWAEALEDYDSALEAARVGGFKSDPYILNSRGNVLVSLGRFEEARESYLESAEIFQASKGFRKGASTTQRLDGAIYASANAALMRAQLGDDAGALRDIEGISRRAPNSADMRAASAALLWGLGRAEEAEDAWQTACTRNEGCVRYKDLDFVSRIRRWPPVMVKKLENFLTLSGGGGQQHDAAVVEAAGGGAAR